jgi:branched-chain amino acid transport system permease protein
MAISVERGTRVSAAAAIVFALLLVVLASAPWWCGRGWLSVLVEVFYFIALAQMWNLLAGYAGVISLGQQAFLGLGGYAFFFLAKIWDWHPLLALVAAGCVGALVAVPSAIVVLRMHGAYLAIGTWVFAEVFRLVFAEITELGAGSGTSLPVQVASVFNLPVIGRDGSLYLLSLLFAVLSLALSYWLLCTRYGLALTSIRDNERAARTCGVDAARLKLYVFVGAAFGTALTGALIYLTKLRISPGAAFDPNWTSYLIFIVVIGGIGTIEGPVIGTIVFFLLRQYLSDYGSWYLITIGGLAVIVMLKMPRGMWGEFAARTSISLFPTRRRVVVDTRQPHPEETGVRPEGPRPGAEPVGRQMIAAPAE